MNNSISKLEWPKEESIPKLEWPEVDAAVDDREYEYSTQRDLYRSKSQPRVRFADDAARGRGGYRGRGRGGYRGRGRGGHRGRGGYLGEENSICRGDNACGVSSCPNKHYGVRNERGELPDCSRLPYCDRKMCQFYHRAPGVSSTCKYGEKCLKFEQGLCKFNHQLVQ